MAVRDRDLFAGPADRQLEPARLRAGGFGEHPVAVLVELDVFEMHDVLGPLTRVCEVDLAELRFDVPGVVGAALDPDVAEPLRARVWQAIWR